MRIVDDGSTSTVEEFEYAMKIIWVFLQRLIIEYRLYYIASIYNMGLIRNKNATLSLPIKSLDWDIRIA